MTDPEDDTKPETGEGETEPSADEQSPSEREEADADAADDRPEDGADAPESAGDDGGDVGTDGEEVGAETSDAGDAGSESDEVDTSETEAGEPDAADAASESDEVDGEEEASSDEPPDDEAAAEPPAGEGSDATGGTPEDGDIDGVAAFYDHPHDLLDAARATRDSEYEAFDAYTPFAIHGMDEAMGLDRSWMPWVTFGAGMVGLFTAIALQFGTMTFDWPLVIGGKPFAPWPSFVPVMFELSVLIGGVTTGIVMLKTAGCFEPADVIDPSLTDDRFALWIDADDPNFDHREVVDFLSELEPAEVRTVTESQRSGY